MSGSDGHGLAGRVAIVTGGGRGLGRAMTLGLAQAGVRVVATAARELAEVEAVAREAERACGDDRVRPLLADVTRAEDCAAVVRAALVRFGRLDILVNNAGRGMKYVSDTFLTEPTRFWEVAPDTWRMVTDTNVNGPFLMARAAVPAMLEGAFAGGGGILRQARPDSRREILLVAAFYGRARKATAQFYPAMATHFEGVWPNAPILNEAERTPKSLCRFIRFQHGQPNLCGTSRSGPAFDRRVN